jgi:hypothetical protein
MAQFFCYIPALSRIEAACFAPLAKDKIRVSIPGLTLQAEHEFVNPAKIAL